MDKLRALHYFAAAAQTASFSAAARRFDVSTAAVAKLVGNLEAALGVRLFDRHAHGLSLTSGGTAYLEACQPALDQLAIADELAIANTAAVCGTVVVGVQPVIALECLTAQLPRFMALYPEIQLDVRYFMHPSEEQVRGLDVMLVVGWAQADNLVQRRLGAVSLVVCASPRYWAAHGVPRHPSELAQHNCLCVRSSQTNTVMDVWKFRRGEEQVEVTARGSVVVDNVHRDLARDLLVAGLGVGRILEWDTRRDQRFAGGALVPALLDWSSPEVPPVTLLYPQSVRRIARVRAFIDFATQLFRELELQRLARLPASEQPRWATARRSRASALPKAG